MKKILAVASLLMVLAGLWMAILGCVEPSSSFRVMVVVGLLVAIVLAASADAASRWVIINGKIIGVVEAEDIAKEILANTPDTNCFAIPARTLDIIRADKEQP
jgi:hypothetical protein